MKPIRSLLKPLLLLIAFSNIAHAFYDPGQGRWLSKDPIEERGGANLYEFVTNSPLFKIDYLGLELIVVIIPSAGEVESHDGETAILKPFHESSRLESDVINAVNDSKPEFEAAIAALNSISPSEWTENWKFEIDGKERTASLAEAKSLFRRELRSRPLVRYLTAKTFESFFKNNLAGIGAELDEPHDDFFYAMHAFDKTFNQLSDGSIVARSWISSLLPESTSIDCLSCFQGDSKKQKGKVIKGEAKVDRKTCTASLKAFHLEAVKF
jgi:hypothetical protein